MRHGHETVSSGGRYHTRHRALGGHFLLQPLQWSTVKDPPKMADDGRTLHSWGAYGRTPTARGAQAEGEQEPADRGGRELPTECGMEREI